MKKRVSLKTSKQKLTTQAIEKMIGLSENSVTINFETSENTHVTLEIRTNPNIKVAKLQQVLMESQRILEQNLLAYFQHQAVATKEEFSHVLDYLTIGDLENEFEKTQI